VQGTGDRGAGERRGRGVRGWDFGLEVEILRN
jgi:hypothetical protein